MKKSGTHWLFYVGRFIFYLLFKTVWRLKIEGRDNVPAGGGVIIAPNHKSMADPPLAGASIRRPIHFMAKIELFQVPVLGFLIRHTNAFPVKRGRVDISAFRNALRLLGEGEPVLVFPEGTRSRDGSFLPARSGIGMLACKSQCPVIPVRIMNSDMLFKLKRLRVLIGKPIFPPENFNKQTYQDFADKIMEEIKTLDIHSVKN